MLLLILFSLNYVPVNAYEHPETIQHTVCQMLHYIIHKHNTFYH